MASKRRLRKKSCTGKRVYDNRKMAWQAVYHTRKNNPGPIRRLTIYKCRFCKKWHIGKKGKR